MAVEHINYSDTLRQGTDKINSAIDQSNEAIATANDAKSTADQALANSENTQTQLDTIVINGDSSVEAAQARVAADGTTFTTLKDRLDDIDAHLAEKANYANKSYLDDDYILYNTYYNGHYQPTLFMSKDGITLHKIGELTTGIPMNIWDYSTMYYNGAFYFAYDYILDNSSFENAKNTLIALNPKYFIGANRMGIARTTDFVNFDYWDIPLSGYDTSFIQTFAPEFYVENGTVYIFFTGTNTNETFTDFNGNVQYKKYCFYIQANDNTLRTFTDPIKVNLTDSMGTDVSSKIDVFVNKVNNNYYLFIKRETETDAYVQEYKSSNLTSGYTLIHEFIGDVIMEAPSVIYFNEKYILTCDAQDQFNPFYVSTDMETWGTMNKLLVDDDLWLRHFTPLLIDTDDKKNVIKNLVKTWGNDPISDLVKLKNDKSSDVENTVNLPINGTISTLTLSPSTVYKFASNDTLTINAIDTSLMKKGDKCYILPAFSNRTAKLTLKHNVNNKIYWSSSGDLTMSFDNGNYDTIYEVICINDIGECFITSRPVSNVFDTNITLPNGLIVKFYKRNGIVTAMIAGIPTTAIPAKSTVSFTGVVPNSVRPYLAQAYGSYNIANDNTCSMKIYSDGRLELNSSLGVTTSQWFECSITYISV